MHPSLLQTIETSPIGKISVAGGLGFRCGSNPWLKNVLMVGVLLIGSQIVRADGNAVLLNAEAGFASRYVRRGIERLPENWQAAVEGHAGGWQGRIWSARTYGSDSPGEIQSSLGYVWGNAEGGAIAVRGTHFWYIDTPLKGAPAHSFEGSVEASVMTDSGWRPAVELAYDIRFRSRTVEASITREFWFAASKAKIELRCYGGHVSGEDVLPDTTGSATFDAYSYFGVRALWSYPFDHRWEARMETSITKTFNQARAWSPVGAGSGTRGLIVLGGIYRF